MRPKRQHTRKMGYDEVTNATLRTKNQLLQQQTHAHTVAGCCCLGAGLPLGGKIVAWCSVQKEEKKRVPLREQKSRVCIKILRACAGIRDAETQSPGMLRKPGDLALSVPKAKKV